jgi:hypothetical protein
MAKRTPMDLDSVTATGTPIGNLLFRPLPIRAANELTKLIQEHLKEAANVILLTPHAFVKVFPQTGESDMDVATAAEFRRGYAREHADVLTQFVAQYSGHPVEAVEQLTTSELLQALDIMLENPF